MFTETIAKIERLEAENARLRAAVINQCGDNLCWLKERKLGQIPPKEEFLASCARYHEQIARDRGVVHGCMTISQLEAELEKYRQRLEWVMPILSLAEGPTEKTTDERAMKIAGALMMGKTGLEVLDELIAMEEK
jgi:hypothetical protein